MNKEFEKELEHLINKYSIENETNTPDFILASYVCNCLYVLESAIKARDLWYKFKPTSETRIAGLLKDDEPQFPL